VVAVAASTGLPTAYHGHVQEAWYAALGDWQEHVADLIWPLSNYTYNQIRRDPQVAAVINAYSLPIRRSTWAVDPTGCRDEVARLVADDLGLPVLGDDQPGPARVRGVSWAEHLRVALLHLTFGHYGFEMLARLDGDGRARLVALADRPPSTITNLHVNDNGDLLGVSQDNRLFESAPQISADRLLWYCHDREGAQWQGTSLLRPVFPAWLLKRECQRILGTSSRRFGMGVPTLRALPGTAPTPEQMALAGQVAQQMRGGEHAGAAIPPGFVVELLGMQGGAPDTLGFLKWLDQQISRSALAQFLDLGGQTSHGSFSLGASFIDLFTLSIAAAAEYMADVVTRQVAARLVEWNWDDTENVPAVTVSDIGTKHEVTADAIQQLVSVGAIQPDPALDAYLRTTFQLPMRDPSTPWRAPALKQTSATPADAAQIEEADAKVTASGRKPRGRRTPSAHGQLELPVAAADQPAVADDDLQAATDDLLAEWPAIAEPMVSSLADQAGQTAEFGNVAALGSLAVSAVVVAGIATALAAAMNGHGSRTARSLLPGNRKPPPDPGATQIGATAQATAGILASTYANAAARVALQRPGADAATVETAVRDALDAMSAAPTGVVADHLGAALHAAEGAALIDLCAKHPPKRLIADELRDSPTCCAACKAADGTEFPELAAALEVYGNGAQLTACAGGSRCRGRLIPKWT
jgi:hypothetical protein